MNIILPVPSDRRGRRYTQLYAGLILYGFSIALMVAAGLGLDPWDVLHQGSARMAGISMGMATIATAVLVLVLWIPLRQKPGLGTLSNVVVIGLAVDASLAILPTPEMLPGRVAFLASGIVLNGVATGCYIGAGMGPGPRDGLMTGLAARGHSIRVVRTLIELSVLIVGWILGGTVGVGTVAYAVAIGPLAHVFIPAFSLSASAPALGFGGYREPSAMPSSAGHDQTNGQGPQPPNVRPKERAHQWLQFLRPPS